MSSGNDSAERNRNLWAPWRSEYIDALNEGGEGCFLCRYRDQPAKDAENLVLYRSAGAFVVMNRFPYTGGHLLVAPLVHAATLEELSPPVLTELMLAVRDAHALLAAVVRADGYNLGMNLGRCAGAGLPGHLHVHIVPRWEGDTNFMSVLGDVRVIPKSLQAQYEELRDQARRMGLGTGTA